MMDLLIAIASLVLHIACICMHASKDSSCSHLCRTWNRLKLWINALLVLKTKSSDQLSMILMNVLQSYCQGCVLFLPNDTWPHYVRCWCQCWCCLSTVMVIRMLFSCPKQTYELGCTCGQVSMVVTMVCIIRAPRGCNDKGGFLALSNLLLYFYLLSLSSWTSSHCHSRSEMQFSNPQGFPCHTFSGHPLIRQCFCFFLVFPSTVISEPSLQLSGQQRYLMSQQVPLGCRFLPVHLIMLHSGVVCGEGAVYHKSLWCGTLVRVGSWLLCAQLHRSIFFCTGSDLNPVYNLPPFCIANRKHVRAWTAGSSGCLFLSWPHWGSYCLCVFSCLMCSDDVL